MRRYKYTDQPTGIKQFYKPYDSTIAFYKILEKLNLLKNDTKKILDIGTGVGGNLKYFSQQCRHIKFLGTDYDKKILKKASKLNKNSNIKFKKLDILKSVKSFQNKFDGLICIHTLCCFKKLDLVIKNFCKIKPKWIAINSLFYEGPLDVLIHIRDHNNKKMEDSNPDGDFNTFSLSKLNNILRKNGYKIVKKHPYFPKKRLKKPSNGNRGSYTIKTEINKHTTFSGPVHLPWYFIIAKKI